MNTQDLLDPKSWAEHTFGGVQLHDMRRTVQAATNLAENLKAAYEHCWNPETVQRWGNRN